MPRGNRKGPAGVGPMAGRQAGYCAGSVMPGFSNPGITPHGFAFNFGGWGRGWCDMAHATGSPGWRRFGYTPDVPQDEAEALKAQSVWLQNQIAAIDGSLKELDNN